MRAFLSRRLVVTTLVLASAVCALAPRPAHAQAQLSEAERKATARTLFADGAKAQDSGKYADALVLFEKAQKLYDAPTHLLHIAQCQVMLGKLVQAAETYETLKRTQLAPGAPEVFVQAKAQAEAELPGIRARIPTLKVELSPKPEQLKNLQLVVNDVIIPTELVGVGRPVNPGPAKIVARADGYKDAQLEVALKEKETRSVSLALVPGQGTLPPPVVVPAPADPQGNPRPEPKNYEPEPPKPKVPGTRIGAVYFPHIPLNGNNDLSLDALQHHIGVEFSFGKSLVRYHLTLAYSQAKIGVASIQGFRIEPATLGFGFNAHKTEKMRVEIEPTIAILNLSAAGANNAGFAALSSGIDVRVNLVFGHFHLGLSPVGLDVRWAAAGAALGGAGAGLGSAVDFRPRIFVGAEF
ncbi:MAG: hypothetical protein U0183_19285 [Polyangiaceae bacterium]